MMTSTMITITTIVPMPINMGFLSVAHRPRGTKLWVLGLFAGLPRAWLGSSPGARASYFLKTSLSFPPACLRRPMA